MVREPGKWVLMLCLLALGVGLVSLPWLPAGGPNPLPGEFASDSAAGRRLLAVLQEHDAACGTGDVASFRTRVTARYADDFADRLHRLGRDLDGAALQAYVGPDRSLGLAAIAGRGCRSGRAVGDRACLIVEAAAAQQGSHGFAFAWDGAAFRLDGVEHQPSVDPDDPVAVAAFAAHLLRDR